MIVGHTRILLLDFLARPLALFLTITAEAWRRIFLNSSQISLSEKIVHFLFSLGGNASEIK